MLGGVPRRKPRLFLSEHRKVVSQARCQPRLMKTKTLLTWKSVALTPASISLVFGEVFQLQTIFPVIYSTLVCLPQLITNLWLIRHRSHLWAAPTWYSKTLFCDAVELIGPAKHTRLVISWFPIQIYKSNIWLNSSRKHRSPLSTDRHGAAQDLPAKHHYRIKFRKQHD